MKTIDVAADREAALGVARVQRERRRRPRDQLEHEVGVEAHDVVLDDLPGLAEEPQRLGVVERDRRSPASSRRQPRSIVAMASSLSTS